MHLSRRLSLRLFLFNIITIVTSDITNHNRNLTNQHRLSISTVIQVHASHHRINTNPVCPSAPTPQNDSPPHSLQHNTTALTNLRVSATHSSSGINSFSCEPSLSDSMRIIYLGLRMRGLRLIIEHVYGLALSRNEWYMGRWVIGGGERDRDEGGKRGEFVLPLGMAMEDLYHI